MVSRTDILKYAEENYNTISEHLWAKSPNNEILRHKHNQKWYAIIMDVPKYKVGLDGDDIIDILNVKCEPDMVLSLCEQKGFYKAYHMNKKHWLTIILDGTISDNEIYNLIDLSYELTN
ncbi:MAG: MmcQ/YjbR family DNA-binding protein [Lachnospiraceae bacterium]|nr:MmcQ/YjbR family DNA-binding protein [Lachnospiraceae bacterium]MDE6252484.1 MmcQ/YjbR family DNA-binding protein [Lachnospiraceae bacterium]